MKNAPTIDASQFSSNSSTPAPAVAAVARRATGTDGKVTITIAGQAIPVRQITIPADEIDSKTSVYTGNERIQSLLTETSLADLTPSFEDAGQLEPGIGRKLDNGIIEIADGSRRRAAAIQTQQPYTAMIGNFSDEQMELISELGNQYREPSAYEKGKKLAEKLEKLHDGKLERLAKAEGQNKENLRRMLDTSGLDEDIVKSYPTPNDLTARTGQKLAKLWNQKNDTERTEYRAKVRHELGILKAKAKRDETPLTADEITKTLLAIGDHSVPDKPQNLRGNVGTVKRTKTGIALNLNIKNEKDAKELQELIEDYLNEK